MRGIVVAAVIVRDGRVLACRRTTPPETAGRWELPGGKVEQGESPEAALVREIGEELGCLIEVGEWLAAEAPIGESHTLRAAWCRVTAGEVRPREHDQIRWLAPDELDQVDWLEPDLPFIAHVRRDIAHVRRACRGASTGSADVGAVSAGVGAVSAGVRAVFFDEQDAVRVEQRLLVDGWSALRSRERLHGEDDDEDQPWVVLTSAPEFVVELLVEEYDGWLDVEGSAPDASVAAAPLEPLPSAPKRIKRPQ